MIDKLNSTNNSRDKITVDNLAFQMVKDYYDNFGPEKAGELAMSIFEVCFTGEASTDDKYIQVSLAPFKEKYKKSENKGGRPRAELDKNEVYMLKSQLKTWKKVAETLGVDEKTLRTYRRKWEAEARTVMLSQDLTAEEGGAPREKVLEAKKWLEENECFF